MNRQPRNGGVRSWRKRGRGCGLIGTPGDIVRLRCSFCRRSHQFARAELLEAYGADCSVVTLQRFLMPDCKHRRNDGCMAVIVR
jgi:hypothetical protein